MTDPESPERFILGSDADIREPLLVHNTLPLTGWALAEAGVEAVRLRVGTREYAASYGLPTDKPHATLPDWPGASHSRFELTLDVSEWPRGEHPFEIVATDRDGATAAISGVADVQPYVAPPADEASLIETAVNGGTAMWCEVPDLAGGEARGHVEVSGWAVGTGGIDKVIVTVDRRLRIEALHGLMRPDLRWCFGDELAGGCGFALRLDPREAPFGWHDLTVVAVANDGAGVGVSGAVHCLPALDTMLPGGADRAADSPAQVQFMPDRDHGHLREPEHHVRYGWAAAMMAGRRVLDAGCGVGSGTGTLAEQATEAVGVDISPAALAEAKEHYGKWADFVEGDLRQLPFDDDTFDAVVCFEAIEQVRDMEAALDELRRVLRPGGLFLVSSANRGVYPSGNPLHASEGLTSEQLRALIDARFVNVSVHRQQTYVGSLVGDDEDLATDDPKRLLDAHVAKSVGSPPGSELYAIVAASDNELPLSSTRIVLGAMVDQDEQRRLSETWQERAIHAEIDAAASRTEAHYVRSVQREALERARAERAAFDEQRSELEEQLAHEHARAESAIEPFEALKQSLSWRITKPLRSLKRVLRRSN